MHVRVGQAGLEDHAHQELVVPEGDRAGDPAEAPDGVLARPVEADLDLLPLREGGPEEQARLLLGEVQGRFRQVGARVMLRGLRTLSDMEYEFTMSLTNLALDPEIETVFLMAKETYSHISSSLIRQIATFGGDLHKFVPPAVKSALEARVRERRRDGRG